MLTYVHPNVGIPPSACCRINDRRDRAKLKFYEVTIYFEFVTISLSLSPRKVREASSFRNFPFRMYNKMCKIGVFLSLLAERIIFLPKFLTLINYQSANFSVVGESVVCRVDSAETKEANVYSILTGDRNLFPRADASRATKTWK